MKTAAISHKEPLWRVYKKTWEQQKPKKKNLSTIGKKFLRKTSQDDQ